MSARGMFWMVLAHTEPQYRNWVMQRGPEVDNPPLPEGFDLQRCKRIQSMLDVYQAQKGHVQVIQLDGWIANWNGGQIDEIKRRLEL